MLLPVFWRYDKTCAPLRAIALRDKHKVEADPNQEAAQRCLRATCTPTFEPNLFPGVPVQRQDAVCRGIRETDVPPNPSSRFGGHERVQATGMIHDDIPPAADDRGRNVGYANRRGHANRVLQFPAMVP